MCMEASGGSWGQQALSFFHHVAKTSARLSGDSPSIKLQQFLQTLSISLHRSNARSILRGAPASPPPFSAVAFARATLAAVEAQRNAHAQSVADEMTF